MRVPSLIRRAFGGRGLLLRRRVQGQVAMDRLATDADHPSNIGLVGAAGVMGGSMMLGALAKIASHGDRFIDQQAQLKVLGLSNQQVAGWCLDEFVRAVQTICNHGSGALSVNDYGESRRIMYRVTLKGDRPAGV